MPPPFDRVVLLQDGQRRNLSVADFLALPLDVRVGVILKRSIEFYEGRTPVDRQKALEYLRQSSARG
jgi:hypothetical protein